MVNLRVVLVALTALAELTLLGGCARTASAPTVQVRAGNLGLSLAVTGDGVWSPLSPVMCRDGQIVPRGRVDGIEVYAVPDGCVVVGPQYSVNGRHYIIGAPGSLPGEHPPRTVNTVRGARTVVEDIDYTVCTNSCSTSPDQVAFITWDHPMPGRPDRVTVLLEGGDNPGAGTFNRLLASIRQTE